MVICYSGKRKLMQAEMLFRRGLTLCGQHLSQGLANRKAQCASLQGGCAAWASSVNRTVKRFQALLLELWLLTLSLLDLGLTALCTLQKNRYVTPALSTCPV